MKKIILAALAVIVLLQMSGCAPSKPTEEVRLISADRLIKRLEANRRKIKTFNGAGTLMIRSSSINAQSSFEVQIKKPDSIKVSFYGPFGIDLAQVLITQKNFQFYDIINNTLYRGALRKDIMKQLLKVDLPFEQVIDALTGSVNLTEELRREPDHYETDGELYILTYSDSTEKVNNIYLVRNSDFAVSRYLIEDFTGKKNLEGSYSNFNSIEEVPIPYKTILEDPKNNQWMKIEYKKIEANKPVDDFKLEIPTDTKIIEW